MKRRIITILIVLFAFQGYSQSLNNLTVRDKLTVTNEIELNDSSVTYWYEDTLVNPPWTRAYVANAIGNISENEITTDSIKAKNDSIYMKSPFTGDYLRLDTIYANTYVGVSQVSGNQYEIPFLNTAGTGFDLSSNLKFKNKILILSSGVDRNLLIGNESTGAYVEGDDNIFIGDSIGAYHENSNRNVFIGSGAYAHPDLISTNNSVAIGYQAGYNSDGDNNVFIGYKAGSYEDHSNRLCISNSDTETPLIYGDFANDSLKFNAKTSSKYYIGQIYIDGDSVINIGTADTYQTIKEWQISTTWSISENMTLTDSMITTAADGNGYYDVDIGASYTHATNNTVVHISLFIDNGSGFIEVTANEAERKIGTGGDTGSAARNCSVWLNNNAKLMAKVKASNTGNLTISHATFNVRRIN